MYWTFYQRQTKAQLKFIRDLFKRYASKTKYTIWGKQKRQFDKMGVETFKNLHSNILELLQTGIDRLFLYVFHIAGRYNLQIDSKPLCLIEKRRSICKHDIHPNERVFFSKEWKKWGCNTHCSKVWSKLRTKRIWVFKMEVAYLYSICQRTSS